MALIAGLYKQCRISERREKERYNLMGLTHETERKAAKTQEKEEKRLAKQAKVADAAARSRKAASRKKNGKVGKRKAKDMEE